MPMQETFFTSRFGQVRDRFGMNWMILHERPMPAAGIDGGNQDFQSDWVYSN
jgi:hypothetical protein